MTVGGGIDPKRERNVFMNEIYYRGSLGFFFSNFSCFNNHQLWHSDAKPIMEMLSQVSGSVVPFSCLCHKDDCI
jgi:hypothetical protein